MGKGNRTRTQRAAEEVFAAGGGNGKNPEARTKRITAITVAAVALLVVACILLSLAVSTGFMTRSKTAAKSDNFKVTGTMLSYYFFYQYNSFMYTYGSYASYLGLNTGASLKTQRYSDTQTWYQYFMDGVKSELKQYLALCEAAKAAGVKLEDKENAEIDEAVKALSDNAANYGYSANNYASLMYGSGVTVKDVRKALELSSLATKYYATVRETIENGITSDDVEKEVKEDKASYFTADTLQYSFKAALNPAGAEATDEEKTTFESDKAAAKLDAENLLKAATSASEFKKALAEKLLGEFDSKFDSVYATNSSSLTEESKPSDEQLNGAKAKIKDYVTKALSDEEAESPDFGDAAYATAMKNTASDLYKYFYTDNYGTVTVKGLTWADPSASDTSDLDKWLFADGRKENDSTLVSSETETSATYTVAVVTSTASKNTSLTKNVAHILISSETAGYDATDAAKSDKSSDLAKAKAEEILSQYNSGEKTLEAFKALAEKNTEDGSVEYKNVYEGQMVASFNDWVFDSSRKEGDVGIVETEYGYHIIYFEGDGYEKWEADARSNITGDRFTDWVDETAAKYHVTFNDSVLNSLSA